MVVEPYGMEMGGRARWYTFAEGCHMPHWEQRSLYAVCRCVAEKLMFDAIMKS